MYRMTKEQAQTLLPEVGDERMECPTIDETNGHIVTKTPQHCVVIGVNKAKLWYTVRFDNGTRECYKVPRDAEEVDALCSQTKFGHK